MVRGKRLKLINGIINSRNNNGTPGCLLEIYFLLKMSFVQLTLEGWLCFCVGAVKLLHVELINNAASTGGEVGLVLGMWPRRSGPTFCSIPQLRRDVLH